MLVVGEKEAAAGTVAVRDRVDGDLARCRWPSWCKRLKRK